MCRFFHPHNIPMRLVASAPFSRGRNWAQTGSSSLGVKVQEPVCTVPAGWLSRNTEPATKDRHFTLPREGICSGSFAEVQLSFLS